MPESISLVKALKDYFDLKASDMIEQFKALTDKDKDDFVEMFAEIGIVCHRTN